MSLYFITNTTIFFKLPDNVTLFDLEHPLAGQGPSNHFKIVRKMSWIGQDNFHWTSPWRLKLEPQNKNKYLLRFMN
jgi:hypothetical protein